MYKTALTMGVGYVLGLSMGRSSTPKLSKYSSLVRLCGERGWRGSRMRNSPPSVFEKLQSLLINLRGRGKDRRSYLSESFTNIVLKKTC